MKQLGLNNEQMSKLNELIGHFYADKPSVSNIHWFELCIRFLIKDISREYATAHLSSMQSFIQEAILEKVIHRIDEIHPVDVLYDIWKNPKNYRVD